MKKVFTGLLLLFLSVGVYAQSRTYENWERYYDEEKNLMAGSIMVGSFAAFGIAQVFTEELTKDISLVEAANTMLKDYVMCLHTTSIDTFQALLQEKIYENKYKSQVFMRDIIIDVLRELYGDYVTRKREQAR